MFVAAVMPSLDIFTVKAMALFTIFMVSMATLVASRVNRQVPGLRGFATGLLIVFVGSVAGISRIVIAGSGIILACNILIVGGMFAMVQSIRRFRGLPPLSSALAILLCSAMAPCFLYWLFVHEDFAKRVAVISFGMAFLCLDASVSMMRGTSRKERLIYWPTGCAFAFSACYLTVRGVAASSGLYGSSLWVPVPIEIASTICGDAAYIGCAFGMLLASNSQLRHEAEKMALYDPLTNLPNRRLLLDRLLNAERDALATGLKMGVIYMDLDGFKQINDTLGHDAGDDLLRSVGTAMSAVLRAGDCLARIGGDEFVVLAEGIENRTHLDLLAGRLRAAVENQHVPGDPSLKMRASFGVAVFPEDGRSGRDVMREADSAIYHSKRRSRIERQATAV
jgi:diguanylate cyclase (GGDEF)-like protein